MVGGGRRKPGLEGDGAATTEPANLLDPSMTRPTVCNQGERLLPDVALGNRRLASRVATSVMAWRKFWSC